ncbi:hypothetical protein [Cupriavidus basilensis]|uniref:hypothetical protein n=1 Tax=Cupriavidus basilensis TaxID=68895 RepID=UPI0039F676EE
MMRRVVLAIGTALAMTACASTGITSMDRDTYFVSKKSAQVGFGPPDGVKADIYKEANEFCGMQDKKVETVSLQTTDSGFARPGSASLQFRCL